MNYKIIFSYGCENIIATKVVESKNIEEATQFSKYKIEKPFKDTFGSCEIININ